MAPADEMNLPPGFGFAFDFELAIDEIRERLSPTFLEHEWVASLRKISKEGAEECRFNHSSPHDYCSTLVYQITFLDLLWTRLFGIANGSSPWMSLRDHLDPRALHGGNDRWICDFEIPHETESTDMEILDFVENEFFPVDSGNITRALSAQMHRLLNEYHSKASAEEVKPYQKRTLEVKEEESSPKRRNPRCNRR